MQMLANALKQKHFLDHLNRFSRNFKVFRQIAIFPFNQFDTMGALDFSTVSGPYKMELSALTALSPLDGRYARQTEALRDVFSECAFMRARVRVEVEWLIALSEFELPELAHISDHGKAFLRGLVENFTVESCQAIKDIEKTTNHDVKAVEYWIKAQVAHDEELAKASEFVHFGCTSEDINNTSHALMLSEGRRELLAFLKSIHGTLAENAHRWAEVPMLSRTHGQTASPTTVGKEWANVAMRLARAIRSIESVEILAKMNGAVGNYNAHLIAYPDFDWEAFSRKVVEERLGATFNTHTIQIEPHDYMAELFHEIERANTILNADSIKVENYRSSATPMAPYNLTAIPARDGSLQVQLGWFAPVYTLDGQYIRAIDSMEVYRAGTEKPIYTTETMNSSLETRFVDQDASEGLNTYRIYAYVNGLRSDAAEISVIAGFAAASAPRNFKAQENEDHSVLLSWNTPESAEGNITYSIIRNNAEVIANGIKDTTFTDIMDIPVCRGGLTVPFDEDEALRRFEAPEIVIAADLGAGDAQATVWTCDFTHDYISINADYRS